jgi:4-amino-4-deoxy-L-arabinose transferase-like glycosyltransferase
MLIETAPSGPAWSVRPAWPAPGRRTENLLLTAVLLLAGALYGWQVAHAEFHSFYATAVKSMTLSWKAFVYGALDPAGSITIDKIPGFLWPQAISARIFGFHPWALALPQAIGGLLAIVVLHRTVRRWAGPTAGLLAAAILALTPVAASVFGKALEDAALTVLLVFAAHAATRAIDTGKLRFLLLSGMWVGLAFQAKMLQSWAVVPAFFLAYLIAAPGAITRRLVHVLAAGAVTVAVSFSWMVLTTITPAIDRPYIDGSTNNSAFAMVIGYNGLARFSQVGLTAAGTGSVAATQGGAFGRIGQQGPAAGGAPGAGTGAHPEGAAVAATAAAGSSQVVGTQPGQVGAVAPGAASPGGAPGTASGGTSAAVPSQAGQVQAGRAGAAAVAAGAGAGAAVAPGNSQSSIMSLLHRHADSGTTGWTKLVRSPLASQVGWLYPLVAMAIATGFWWRRGRSRTDPVRAGYLLWTGWLVTTGLGLSAGSVPHSTYVVALAPALAALAAAGLSSYLTEWRNPTSPARAWALPVALALTSAWSWHVSAHYPAFLPWLVPGTLTLTAVAAGALAWRNLEGTLPRRAPAAVPALAVGVSVLALLAPATAWSLSVFDSAYDGSSGNASAGPYDSGFTIPAKMRETVAARMNPFNPAPSLDPAQQHLLSYLTAHRSGAKYLLATESWGVAAPYIMDDAASVLPMGGFSGNADFPTPAQFSSLVSTDRDQYVLLSGPNFMGRGGPDLQDIAATVARTCALVPADSYGGVPGETAPLYHCGASS